MTKPPRPKLFLHRAAAWIAAAVGAGAFYLLLIDTTSLPELIVLGGAAAIAASGFELAREQQTVGGLTGRLRWLARLHRPLLKVPSDFAQQAIPALRQVVRRQRANGAIRDVPVRCAPEHDSQKGRPAEAEG